MKKLLIPAIIAILIGAIVALTVRLVDTEQELADVTATKSELFGEALTLVAELSVKQECLDRAILAHTMLAAGMDYQVRNKQFINEHCLASYAIDEFTNDVAKACRLIRVYFTYSTASEAGC